MIIKTGQQGTPEWKQSRYGKITGSRAKEVCPEIPKTVQAARLLADGIEPAKAQEILGVSKTTITNATKALAENPEEAVKSEIPLGWYKVLAETIANIDDIEDLSSSKEYGIEMEPFARAEFEKRTGKKVEEVSTVEREDENRIACSPDGLIKNRGKYTEAVEIKCLAAWNHLKGALEDEIPSEYLPQVYQQFIVNEDLKSLYFVLYDPRIHLLPFHVITVNRKDVAPEIERQHERQLEALSWVDETVRELKNKAF